MTDLGPLFEPVVVRKVALSERRAAVLRLLLDGHWHGTHEISSPDVGGTEGTRRLRELRADGHAIEKRKREGSDEYEYRKGC